MFPGNMNQMMKQVQKMQQNMLKAQEEIAKKTVEASAGGAVKVTVTGDKRLVNITIAKEVVDPEDVEMLQDLILTAVNEGMKKAEEMSEAELKKVMPGGLPKIPGLF
jgi:DNA-binding YbaB/EbfC family protein